MRAGVVPAMLAAVGMTLGGCATGGAVSPAQDIGVQRPSAVGDDLVVGVEALGEPVVIDPIPDGYTPRGVRLDDPSVPTVALTATLYGDPRLADTLDGPVLVVGISGGSASIGGGPPERVEAEEVDLGGRTGWLQHHGDKTYVGFEVYEQDNAEFVIARGLTDEQVLTAARTATFGSLQELDPNSLPAGMEPVLRSGPTDGPWLGNPGLSLWLEGPAGSMSVAVVRADPRLAALWGFWTSDAAGTEIAGHAGSSGELGGTLLGNGQPALVWAADGLVYSVSGDPGTPLAEVAAALRPGTAAEFAALTAAVTGPVVTPERLNCPGATGLVRFDLGAEDEAAFTVDPGGEFDPHYCLWDGGPGSAGGPFAPPSDGELSTVGLLLGAPYGTAVGGIAPPGTVRVTVSQAGGPDVEALLVGPGPRAGEVMFAVHLPDHDLEKDGPATATAYDANGAVLATAPVRP